MQVTALFTGYVNALLAEHAQNPAANWKAKDCAIYLVVALTVRGRTAAHGATTTNQLVDIGEFYNSQAWL
jgi:exportin-2 (importin alpha re-exporter)